MNIISKPLTGLAPLASGGTWTAALGSTGVTTFTKTAGDANARTVGCDIPIPDLLGDTQQGIKKITVSLVTAAAALSAFSVQVAELDLGGTSGAQRGVVIAGASAVSGAPNMVVTGYLNGSTTGVTTNVGLAQGNWKVEITFTRTNPEGKAIPDRLNLTPGKAPRLLLNTTTNGTATVAFGQVVVETA